MRSTLARGVLAGVAGTAAMSVVQLAWRVVGPPHELGPRVLTDAALFAAGANDPPEGARNTATALAHFGFGACGGIGYAATAQALGTTAAAPGVVALGGAGYGLALWAANYATWIPALGLLPPPADDVADRQVRLVVGHLVFGLTAALVDRAAAGWSRG